MSDKIPVKSITLTRVEGRHHEVNRPRTVKDWEDARGVLAGWSLTAPDLGYHKCDFTVVFTDDFEYNGRFDLTEDGPFDLAAQCRRHLLYVSGQWCPPHMGEADYRRCISYVSKDQQERAGDLLKTHDFGN